MYVPDEMNTYIFLMIYVVTRNYYMMFHSYTKFQCQSLQPTSVEDSQLELQTFNEVSIE